MTTSTLVMPFGKHKGTAITELKTSYVNWLLTLDSLNPDLRLNLEALVAEREAAIQQKKAMAIRLNEAFTRRYPPAKKRAKGSLFWA
jgi:hypothetical protein